MLSRTASAGLEAVKVQFLADSGCVATTLGKVDGTEVAHGRPVRTIPTYKGQRNHPGVL